MNQIQNKLKYFSLRKPRDGQHEPDVRVRGGGEVQVLRQNHEVLQRGLQLATPRLLRQRESAGW